MIKDFKEYIEEGIVIKKSKDPERAKNLILESERKYARLLLMITKMGVDDSQANDYIEDCYNILLFLFRAKMLLEGYSSSGKGAHEAEVAFARNLDFSDADVRFLDQLRYFRNGIFYYGKSFDAEYAHKVILFTKKIYSSMERV